MRFINDKGATMSTQKPINLNMNFEGPPVLFQLSEKNAEKEAQGDNTTRVSGHADRSVLHRSGLKRTSVFEKHDSIKLGSVR
jgi:hypothetical protein